MIPELPKRKNVMWEVSWSTGIRELVEACALYQSGGFMFSGAEDPTWTLYNEGRGMVWTAKKQLIDSIRCLDPDHIHDSEEVE